MERTTIEVGGFQVNCSILSENGAAWIVDPGQESDRIIAFLKANNLTPKAILLTHAHFDHIGGVPGLQKVYPDLPVYLHQNDHQVVSHPMNQLPPEYPRIESFNPSTLTPHPSSLIPSLKIIETPGHTPGGVCFYFPSPLFPHPLLLAGDTLFAGSVGRTYLPGGDMKTLMQSLQKLIALPEDTIVVPGHGPETTIGAEKRDNTFLRFV